MKPPPDPSPLLRTKHRLLELIVLLLACAGLFCVRGPPT
jgi:hypothetical protein